MTRLTVICISFIVVSLMLTGISDAKVGTWEYKFADVKGDAWKKDWKIVQGKFEVKDKSLAQTDRSGDDNNAFRAIAQTNWEIADGTIEAEMKHDPKASGTNDALVFYRMKDDDNGYASRLQFDDYITIGKITAGRHSHIKYVSTPVDADIWYVVKVELKGKKITVFVNDKEFLTAEDDFSLKGKVGFGMSRSTADAYLSWIRVTGEGVTSMTAVSPSGKLATTWADLKK